MPSDWRRKKPRRRKRQKTSADPNWRITHLGRKKNGQEGKQSSLCHQSKGRARRHHQNGTRCEHRPQRRKNIGCSHAFTLLCHIPALFSSSVDVNKNESG